jgi:nucleoside-diphosphate-sugar epimerase
MKILITGASGFVGGSFVQRFQNDPSLVIHGIGRRPIPQNRHYTQKDLSLPFDLDFQPDTVIHAAARALPWGTERDFQAQNVTATRNVVDFCLKRNVKNLVYLSSSSVFYQEKDQFAITEQSPIGPKFVNRYAATKYAGELIIKEFPGRWVILRPRAVFGPGDTVLFPRILQAAQKGKMMRFSRPAPPVQGDLIYIESLCDYMLKAATDPSIQGDFNLTNNQPVEIEPFLLRIFEELNIAAPTKQIPQKRALMIASAVEAFFTTFLPKKEPPITRFGIGVLTYSKTFDVAKALEVLGPPSVDLATGVQRFLEWQKSLHPQTLQRP